MNKYVLVARQGDNSFKLEFRAKTPDRRVKFRVTPHSMRSLVENELIGEVDERGILFTKGNGSCIGVSAVLVKAGYGVQGTPDYETSEEVT